MRVGYSSSAATDASPSSSATTETLCTVWFRSSVTPFFAYEDPGSAIRLIYIQELGLLVSITTPVGDDEAAAALAAFEAALTLTPLG